MSREKKTIGYYLSMAIEKMLGIEQYHGEVLLVANKEMRRFMNQYEKVNRKIWLIVIAICAYGALIQYSASCYMCANGGDYDYDSFYLVKRQVIFMLVGFAVMWIMQYINYQILFSRLVFIAYFLGVGSILLLKTPLAFGANGAKRWVRIVGPINFAPAEITKIVVVLMLAYMIQRMRTSLDKPIVTYYLWAVGAIPAGMVFVLANDFSSAAVILMITFATTLVFTRNWKHHTFWLLVIGLAVVAYVMHVNGNLPPVDQAREIKFRDQRIVGWLYPEVYYDNIGYQIANTLYVVGAGGIFGQGLGSFQMLGGLVPYAYTDVIFGVVVYELGLTGALCLLILYAMFLYEALRVMINAEDMVGSVIAIGIFLHIAVQVLFHVGVVLNVLPNTGQTLPWVSYGGSTLMCLGIEVGLLLSIVRSQHFHYAKAEIKVGNPSDRVPRKSSQTIKNK